MLITEMASPIGERIKRLRAQHHLTQGQLAEYAHVSRSWLSLVESGDIQNPGGDRLNRVAVFLGVTVREILTGQGATDDELVPVPAEKAGTIRNFVGLPLEALIKLERMARIAFLEGVPPNDQTHDERQREAEPDEPEPQP